MLKYEEPPTISTNADIQNLVENKTFDSMTHFVEAIKVH
jgi:hypothetical protein